MPETDSPAASLPTEFAPAERRERDDLLRLAEEVVRDPVVCSLMETVGGHVLVLSPERQILAASGGVLQALYADLATRLVGARPGEAFGCAHAEEGPAGCGTGEACQRCGAVLAILCAQASGEAATCECRMEVGDGGDPTVYHYRVRAVPTTAHGHAVILVILHDITRQRQRLAGERQFLHDLVNMVGAIMGWSDVLALSQPDGPAERILALSVRLSEQIAQYRAVSYAEEGALEVHPTALAAADTLADLRALFAGQEIARERTLWVDLPAGGLPYTSDPALVERVLGNMVRNALEASEPGAIVRIWCEAGPEGPVFRVHNPGVIPEPIAARIFRRGFSTKPGVGHGLGSYGMKLIAERYLGGRIWFESTRAAGTTFSLSLPADGPPAAAPSAPPVAPVSGSEGLDARLREAAVSAHVAFLCEMLERLERERPESAALLREVVDEYVQEHVGRALADYAGVGATPA